MLAVVTAAAQLVGDRPRVVGALLALPADEDHRVAQPQRTVQRVEGLLQFALVVRAALAECGVRGHLDHRDVELGAHEPEPLASVYDGPFAQVGQARVVELGVDQLVRAALHGPAYRDVPGAVAQRGRHPERRGRGHLKGDRERVAVPDERIDVQVTAAA